MHFPEKEHSKPSIIRPKNLIKHPHQFLTTDKWQQYTQPVKESIEVLPTTIMPVTPQPPSQTPSWQDTPQRDPDASIPSELFDVSSMSTVRLMAISGLMRTGYPPVQWGIGTPPAANATGAAYSPLPPSYPLDLGNHYASDIFGQTHPMPPVPLVPGAVRQEARPQPAWKTILSNPAVKIVLGLLLGIAMLFLISRFVDIPTTLSVLRQHLTTPQGLMDALLAATSFIVAFSIRGARWRLFLSRICQIKVLTAIQVFWVAVFLNFLLPIQGGEVAKCLILKRIKRVPISQSLPTVAMDKSLDLMPALFIMATVPFIPGMHMSPTLWLILGLVSSILLGIIFTVTLMAWNRTTATKFIQLVLKVLPKGIGGKIENFALGFIDSLLTGASSPKTFIPAVLLTCLAITCDGLFAWFAFLTVGVSTMNFATAIFGYTTYNMFNILPSPPGQVGSNELAGVLVFGELLGFPKPNVLAMFVFSHPLAALIMTIMCVICLSSLGLSLAGVIKINVQKNDASQMVAANEAIAQPSNELHPYN